jgi:uncharacterized protein (DUF2267 family)
MGKEGRGGPLTFLWGFLGMLSVISRVVARYVASRAVEAMEFNSPQALRDYLHEHPGADPRKHRVRPNKGELGENKNRAQYKPDKGVAKSLDDLGGPAKEHPFIKKLKRHLEGDQPVPKNVVDHALEALHEHMQDDDTSKEDKGKLRQLQQKLKSYVAQS